MGFLDWVKGMPDGPLFYARSSSYAVGGGGGEGYKLPLSKKRAEQLAKWVRDVAGVTDPHVQPNHAWRHRFKTEARRINMPPDVRDYIQGHKPRTEGEEYGHMPLEVVAEWIGKMPPYSV
jgi:hypothetical protein